MNSEYEDGIDLNEESEEWFIPYHLFFDEPEYNPHNEI